MYNSSVFGNDYPSSDNESFSPAFLKLIYKSQEEKFFLTENSFEDDIFASTNDSSGQPLGSNHNNNSQFMEVEADNRLFNTSDESDSVGENMFDHIKENRPSDETVHTQEVPQEAYSYGTPSYLQPVEQMGFQDNGQQNQSVNPSYDFQQKIEDLEQQAANLKLPVDNLKQAYPASHHGLPWAPKMENQAFSTNSFSPTS